MNDKQTKEIADHVEKTLKDNFIKNMVQGSEIAYQLVIDCIDDGYDVNKIREFCENNIKNRKKLVKEFTNKRGKK